jgi:UDP-3-O-[3-hydroxymyristoyl] glucosamine N-acyltransferase
MLFTTGQLAEQLGGTLEGASEVEINLLCAMDEAEAGGLCFLLRESFASLVPESPAAAIVVGHEYVNEPPAKAVLIRVPEPGRAFIVSLTLASMQVPEKEGIHPSAVVDPTATVGKGVYIGHGAVIEAGAAIGNFCKIYPNVYVGDGVNVGANTVLYPNVVLYRGTTVGRNCILHAGASIGADGFGFIPLPDGSRHKIPHVGGVIIGNDVEVGANSTIDRATMGFTRIGSGTKIDNLVLIAHNNQIGKDCVIAGQSGIAGSCKVGDGVVLAAQVGVADHVELADKITLTTRAGTTKDLKEVGGVFRGAPAQKVRDQLRLEAYLNRVPELNSRIDRLEKELEALRAELGS